MGMKVSSSISSSRLKIIINSSMFLVLLCLLLFGMGEIFHVIYGSEIAAPGWKRYNDNIDVLIIGSSQAQHGFNPLLFREETGLFTYNNGSAGQQMDSAYFLLRDILKENKPRLVIIDIYWRALDHDLDFSQLAANYERIVDPNVKRDFYHSGFPLKSKVEYSLKILRYRQSFYWTMESFLNRLLYGEKSTVTKNDARDPVDIDYYGHSRVREVIPDKLIEEQNKFRNSKYKPLSKRQEKYIKTIIEFCRQENIDIVAVSAPIMPVSFEMVSDFYQKINSEYSTLFSNYSIDFYDLNYQNRDDKFLNIDHFYDENHLNAKGADILTEEFLNLLKKDRHIEN